MVNNGKRILITGGSGFIGTNLVESLIGSGASICNIDIKSPQMEEHQKFWSQADLMDRDSITSLVKSFRPTHVVHLAARADLKGKTEKDYALNTRGTEILMDVLDSETALEHVLFTSTMLVCRPGYIPVNGTDFAPATPYGESKMMMEELIRKKNPSYRWNIIRPSSIWGPWFASPYRDFFDRVLQGSMFSIGGMDSATKTYGFILNSVKQIKAILDSNQVHGQVYYIGDEPPINIRSWTDMVAATAGMRKPPVIHHLFIRAAGLVGDVLGLFKIGFPMTSFRFKNMTTDNVLPLENTMHLSGPMPYDLQKSTQITLQWIKQQGK